MANHPLHNEKALLTRLSQGDEDAFEMIFQHYRDRIYKTAMIYLKSAPLAEEAVQDVFLKLWMKRTEVVEIQNIEAWLFRVGKNHILNQIRDLARERKRQEKIVGEAEIAKSDTDHKLRHAAYNEILQKAISALPAQQQRAFRLAREQGFTYEEISKEMSVSPHSVKTHIQRASKAVREFLRQQGDIYIILFIILNSR